MNLGERMKLYESETERRLMPLLPVVARLDGKCFHTFTKGMGRPYDKGLSDLLVSATKMLVGETNALVGYTQSDEITLAWYSPTIESQIFFDGRVLKMSSILSAMLSVWFNEHKSEFISPTNHNTRTALFDCRVWNVPTLAEASNVFVWREQDATRNSVSMAAQSVFSHKELHGKSCSEMQEMLYSLGNINWNNYPNSFKRGTYVRREERLIPFSVDELDRLPPKHKARSNPDLKVVRREVVVLDIPPITRISNREGVLFFGEEPKLVAE